MRVFSAAAFVVCISSAGLFGSPVYQSFDVPGSYSTEAWSINSSGSVAGYYGSANGNLGFVYTPSTNSFQTLSGPAGASDVQAFAINDNGVVAGSYRDASNNTHAFIYSNGSYTTLNGPSAQYGTQIWGINASGQLALTYATNLFNNAYRWTPDGHGGYTTESLSIGPDGTFAGGMNNNGDIVGYYQNPNYGGFVWHSNGTDTTFNVPDDGGTTQALGINDNGVIVGSYFDGSHIAGYILQNQTFTEINPPGSTYTYATGIDDNGEITGWYMDSNGHTHSFLANTASAPEPASFGMAVLGIIGFAGYAYRRRSSKGASPIQ